MGSNTRIIDSLDKPNAPTSGAGYDAMYPPSRRERAGAPPPPWLIGIGLALGALGVLGALALLWQFIAPLVPMWRESLDASSWWLQRAFGVLAVGVPIALLWLVGAVVFAAGRRLWAWSQQGRIVRLENDHPVDVSAITGGGLALAERALVGERGHYAVAGEYARTPGHAIQNWSPTTTSVYRPQITGAPAAEEAPPAATIQPAYQTGRPLLAQLRERGYIDHSGAALFVGTDDAAQPVHIDMQTCGFIGILGQPRFGKTTAAKLLITQAALLGWHIFLCDYHIRKPTSLASQLTPLSGRINRIAATPEEIADTIRLVHRIGRRRMEGNPINGRVLLVIEELTNMVLDQVLPADVLDLIPSIAVAYPGVQVHGLVIMHDASQRMLGGFGAVLRRGITHRVVTRVGVGGADLILPSGALARQAAELERGSALFWGDESPMRVHVPLITEDDVTYAAEGVPARPYQGPPVLPPAEEAPAAAPAAAPAPRQVPATQPLPGLAGASLADRVLACVTAQGADWSLGSDVADRLGYVKGDAERDMVFAELARLAAAGQLERQGRRKTYRYRAIPTS